MLLITALLCHSFSIVGALLQDTILPQLHQCRSFLQAAALHELLQSVPSAWGTVLQEQTAPLWVPHLTQFLPEKKLSVGAILYWPQFLPGSCACGFSMACSFLQDTSTSCGMGFSVCCTVNTFSEVVIHGRYGGNIMIFSTGCQGICFGSWITSCPHCAPLSFFTSLGVCNIVSQTFLFLTPVSHN